MSRRIAIVLLLLSVLSAHAAESPDVSTMPEILDLRTALAIAETAGYPELDIAESKILASAAELSDVRSDYGVRSSILMDPRFVYSFDPVDDDVINDSYYRVGVNKRLTDFGYTQRRADAAEADVLASASDFVSSRFRHRLAIIRAYLDVLLADSRYAVDTEAMTLAYLRFDKARDRHELGEVSDVDLLGLESAYRRKLIDRTRAANRQSEARAALAALLNRPDEFPAELEPIELRDVDAAELPEYQALLDQVVTHNPELQAQTQRVQSALAAVEASKLQNRPRLDGGVELGNYKRRYGEGLKWRVGVNLEIPLLQGGKDRAETARLSAELMEQEARLKLLRNRMRETVLALVQELEALQLALKASQTELEYRDLYLDRSRSRYELEIQTDLGDAARNLSEAQWRADKVKYGLLLTRARLDALLGRDPAHRLLGGIDGTGPNGGEVQ